MEIHLSAVCGQVIFCAKVSGLPLKGDVVLQEENNTYGRAAFGQQDLKPSSLWGGQNDKKRIFCL